MPVSEPIPVDILIGKRRFRSIFADPNIRTPCPDDMFPDVDRMARSIARHRQDPTTAPLNEADIYQELMVKWTIILNKEVLNRIPNRTEAFMYVKAAFANHARSLIGKHRGTVRRGGRKVVETASGTSDTHVDIDRFAGKTPEFSINDEEMGLQISDPTANWSSQENLISDVAPFLTPIQLLILRELSSPSGETLSFASLDSWRGHESRHGSASVRILERHYAQGLGLDFAFFKAQLAALREKIQFFRSDMDVNEKSIEWNRNLALLENAFDIQVPRSLSAEIVRRTLSLAAVDCWDIVQSRPDVVRALIETGSRVPQERNGRLTCFGILYQPNARTCGSCSYRKACEKECRSFGVNIAVDPKLLAGRVTRMPSISSSSTSPAPIFNEKDEFVYNWLMEHSQPLEGSTQQELIFGSKEGVGKIRVLTVPGFKIRLESPAESLKIELEEEQSEFFIPGDLTAQETIEVLSAYLSEVALGKS